MSIACDLTASYVDASACQESAKSNSLNEAEALDLIDPLRHFLGDVSFTSASTSPTTVNNGEPEQDVRDLPSSQDYSIVPSQTESIIDRRIVIRYYKDASKTPLLFEPGTATQLSAAQSAHNGIAKSWDVSLKLDMTNGCGGKIWPAAEVLGAYIAAHYSDPVSSPWIGKTIVELGSGTGLVGFLVAELNLRDTRILVTDQIPMLSLMRENQELNSLLTPARDDARLQGATVQVEELNWGEPIPSVVPSAPDVLLLADCVYLESAFEPLVKTMKELSSTHTEILFCYQKRRKADKRFFSYLKKHFTFKDVDDDDPARTTLYRRQGTQLLRVYKSSRSHN